MADLPEWVANATASVKRGLRWRRVDVHVLADPVGAFLHRQRFRADLGKGLGRELLDLDQLERLLVFSPAPFQPTRMLPTSRA